MGKSSLHTIEKLLAAEDIEYLKMGDMLSIVRPKLQIVIQVYGDDSIGLKTIAGSVMCSYEYTMDSAEELISVITRAIKRSKR